MRADPAVLVVAYGQPALLRLTLAPIAGDLNVVVVDNSCDAAVASVARSAGARYVLPPRNLGFAGGVNLGLARIGVGRDVLLLNPDAVLDVDGVRALAERLHAPGPRRAAVAPALRHPDGSPEPWQWPIPSPLTVWAGALGLGGRLRGPRFLPGTALLLHADAIAEIGPFDERFFLYSEETDWQMRARRAGWRVEPAPDVVAVHVGGATSTDSVMRSRLFHGSAEVFGRKWFGARGWWLMRAGSLAAALRRVATARSSARRGEQWRVVRLYVRGPVRSLPEWAHPDRPRA